MKIAIAGYGIEGEANYAYWNTPGNEVTIVDAKTVLDRPLPEGAFTILGDDAFGQLDGFDMVVRTAGLNPNKIKTDGKIWSSTNEFLVQCPAPIIGVTGTKGKGTTSSLIKSILGAAGKNVHLVGNIGVAPLGALPDIESDDVVVFEMSSFQLWDVQKSPNIAVVLMIEADHLNVHADFEDYVGAKANIRRYQGQDDHCIYHPTNLQARRIAMTSDWQSNARRYGIQEEGQVYVKSNTFFVQDTPICDIGAVQIPGQHNVDNTCAAISAALHFTADYEAIERGIRAFEGLPHRIEFVRELEGVLYYNDSFSSAPGATIAAIKSFEQQEILILGGTDKGADFLELTNVLAVKDNIKKIIVMGEIREKLANLIAEKAPHVEVEITDLQTLKPIVDRAVSIAVTGDVVVLSPGCASFDMFRDFYDRGDQFRKIVQEL